MALRVYAEKVRDSVGLAHQVALRSLRWYLKTTKLQSFKEQVGTITDINLLKTLWEAGLNSEQQKIVLARYEELKRRRM